MTVFEAISIALLGASLVATLIFGILSLIISILGLIKDKNTKK
jgi:hypothetical protein